MFKPAQFSVPEGDTNPLHGKAMTNLTSSEDFMPLFNEPRFEASNKCRARETLFRCVLKNAVHGLMYSSFVSVH